MDLLSLPSKGKVNLIVAPPRVLLEICKQVELEVEVLKAARAKANKKPPKTSTVHTRIIE